MDLIITLSNFESNERSRFKAEYVNTRRVLVRRHAARIDTERNLFRIWEFEYSSTYVYSVNNRNELETENLIIMVLGRCFEYLCPFFIFVVAVAVVFSYLLPSPVRPMQAFRYRNALSQESSRFV